MTDVIRMMAAEGITKQDIMAIRPILRTWIGGGWTDGPQLARLLAKHEATLAKFKPTRPVKLWRNERTPAPNGHTGIEMNNHGAEDQYTRPTAWSMEKMSAETYASGTGRTLVTALVSPEDIYCSIPLVDYWCGKLGLKPIDEHRQAECIVKPNPSFVAQIRRPVARKDEQALRQELEQAMLAAYLPELAKAQQEGRKVISEQELRSRLSGVAKDTHIEDLPEKIREWQGRKVASAFCYGVTAAFTFKPKRDWKDYQMVLLDVDKVEASYSKDPSFYVGPQGAGGIGKRYERFQQWLEANPDTPIDPPFIGLTPSGSIIFGDGRHRWAVLRDMGEKRIPAMVAREDLKAMQEKFGAGQAKVAREEQWGLDSLKKWFAGSKIVDAQGNPLPVHHGSTRGGISQSTVQFSFFTPDKAVAATYSKDDTLESRGDKPTVQSFYLRILNPLEVDAQGAAWMLIPFEGRTYTTNELAGLAKQRGHDGLIIRNVEDNVNDEELPPADVIVTLGGRAQIKSAEENAGTFSPEDHSVFAKVASKTLYHGTSLAKAKKIMAEGLEPQVGSLVQTAYGDEGDYDFEPLAFAADKQGINRGVYSAMLHAISAEGHDTTNREQAIRNYGAIVVLKDGEDVMEHRPDGEGAEFDYSDHPLQVETGDYYSREGLVPDYVITGPALVRFFKRNGGDFLHRGLNPKRVNALIGMVKKAHPGLETEKIVEKVWSLSPHEFTKSWNYYSALQTSKAASTKLLYWGGRPGATHLVPKNTEHRAGIWLTDSIKVAASFGTEIYRVEVTGLNNPLLVDAQGEFYSEIPTPQTLKDEGVTLRDTCTTDNIVAYALTKGYDSAIIQNVMEGFSGGGVGLSHQTGTDYVLLKEGQARIVSSFDYKSTLDVWGMPKDPKLASYEDETQKIKENADLAAKPHKFKPGKWTFPNGHPRCIICGDEEMVGGECLGRRVAKSQRVASVPHVVFHGTQKDFDRPKRQNGILWTTPDQHMALAYANTYWRKGVPTLWAIRLNPSARVVALWDLGVPVIREIKDQIAAERKMQFGVGISDAAWDSYADFSILEQKRWVVDALKKARIDAIWVHDTEHMGGGDQRNSLAILTDRAITSVTNVTPKVPKSASGRRIAKVVFHGTPHDFDEFKLEHIGRGEGNQTYGWGLYFTEVRDVADYYRDTLANRDQATGYANAHQNAQTQVQRFGGPEHAAEVIREQMGNWGKNEWNYQQLERTLQFIESGDYAKPLPNQGLIYEVDIPEGPYLLWDRPLAEQPAPIQTLMDSSIPWEKARFLYESDLDGAFGKSFYTKLRQTFTTTRDAQAASNYLRDLGIVGIKYLDGGSRSQGEGTFNYVIFNDKDVRVVKKGSTSVTAGLSGFNVNDSEFPWTQWILEGKKTIETRNSPSLNAHVGERVGIIRTGGWGPAALVGYCTLGQPKVYRSNAEFRADDALHLVPQGSGFDIPPGGVKYGYPISNVEPCEPQRVEAQGRVWRRLAAEDEPSKITQSA